MATLGPYFGAHTGPLNIYLGPVAIGSGTFEAFDDVQAEFTGSYAIFGKPGTFTIGIKLSASSPGSSSGPCQITLNGKTDAAATYRVNDQKIAFTMKLNDTPIEVYARQNGTQVDNVSGHNIWIGQWG